MNYEQLAQRAGEERLNAISDYEEAWEASNGQIPDLDNPACAPFCGCVTCVVREILDAAWPHLMDAAREEASKERDA